MDNMKSELPSTSQFNPLQEGGGNRLWSEENPGSAATHLLNMAARGEAQLSPDVNPPKSDPIQEWLNTQPGGLEGVIKAIDEKGWADNLTWKLSYGKTLTVAEAKALWAAQNAKPTSPTPEARPTPADWRETLPTDQKQRLNEFEAKITELDANQLQSLLNRIKQLQALAPIDGWQNKEIKEVDVISVIKLIEEKIFVKIPRTDKKVEIHDPFENLSPKARNHLENLRKRFKLTAEDNKGLIEKIAEEYHKSEFVGRNLPAWLFPPHLKNELLSIFNIGHPNAKRKEPNGR